MTKSNQYERNLLRYLKGLGNTKMTDNPTQLGQAEHYESVEVAIVRAETLKNYRQALAAAQERIAELESQLAERSEYEVVPDGEHVAWVDDRGHGYKFELDGQRLREIPLPYEIFLDEPTADVHLPKGWHICRHVQREDV